MKDFIKYIFLLFILIIGILTYVFVIKDKKNVKTNNNVKEQKYEKDLRVGIVHFDTLNPIISKNQEIYEISKLLYEPLFFLDDSLFPHPSIAKKLTKISDNKYNLEIKEDILFNDNTKIDIDDVIYSFELSKKQSPVYSKKLLKIEEFKKSGENTLEIILNGKEDYLEYLLNFPILKRPNKEEKNKDKNKIEIPVGYGKYVFKEQNDKNLVFKYNEKYFKTKPKIEEISVTLYDTYGELYSAFKEGFIDIICSNRGDLEKYIGKYGYTKKEYKNMNLTFLAFNTEKVTEKNLRKAIFKAIPKEIALSKIGEEYIKSEFPLDFGTYIYNGEIEEKSNLNDAKKFMEMCALNKNNKWYYKEELDRKVSLKLLINGENQIQKVIGNNIKNFLENFGIEILVEEEKKENYLKRLEQKDYELIIIEMQNSFAPNIESFLGENNFSNYRNETILKIIENIKQKTTKEEKIKEMSNIISIYLENVPFISLCRGKNYIYILNGVNAEFKPNSHNIYQNIENWYRN